MQDDNVRVAVRVRPLLPKERLVGEHICVKLVPSTNQLVLGKDRAFTFDSVLSSKTSQQEVYEQCVAPLVLSCFEGYNATVFAYGQTGSGKTYTIGGDNLASLTEDEFGIIPRAISDMFQTMQSNSGRDYTVKVSCIEIYKEELLDLLDLGSTNKDLHIREDDKGNTVIVGASEVCCESLEEVMSCLHEGASYRHTGSTQMNDASSRSHSIFTVIIEQRWVDDESLEGKSRYRKRSSDEEIIIQEPAEEQEEIEIEHYICAKFHFVDLAGSERVHRTGNVGDRFKESVYINSGLLALGNVISALGDVKKKATHIPYRDSKITRLLKDSLGGNAKTQMICCISPSSANFDESLNALKYANRARNIKNKPIVNKDPQTIRFEEMQCEIRALREELQRQRTSLITGYTETDTQRAMEDASQIKILEEKIIALQTECSHYSVVTDDAFKQLIEIQDRNLLTQSLTNRLRNWLELIEEIKNKVPATLNKEELENRTITRLKDELKQCKNDLKSDEEIFAEKVREVNTLQEKFADLDSKYCDVCKRLEEAEERLKQQDVQLVEREVCIEDLHNKLKMTEERLLVGESQSDLVELEPPSSERRAKSVPVQMLGNQSSRRQGSGRNIHTSPALFSLERVMQSFRARSQLLVSRLEDSDEVLQQHFSDDEMQGDEQKEDKEEIIETKKSAFHRNKQHRATYKVTKPKFSSVDDRKDLSTGNKLRSSQTDDEKLSIQSSFQKLPPCATYTKGPVTSSAGSLHNLPDITQSQEKREKQKKKLKQTELEVRQSTLKMRDLSINIKMKEQLIRELVKTGKDAQFINKQNQEKIQALDKEKQLAQAELYELQKAMQELEAREQNDKAEKDRLQSEFAKKMELAKTKIHGLQKKRKETEKISVITGQNDKKIRDLEMAVEKMRHQQDGLHRRLKDEVDRKAKLEREMQKEQQRVKELEVRNEQQKKVLKVKTQEMTVMQRRLRNGPLVNLASSRRLVPISSDSVQDKSFCEEQSRLEEQKNWLDSEMNKVLNHRREIEELEQDVRKREKIVLKKEAMIQQKSELEIRKLRSSQVLNNDIVTVSHKLETVERKLEDKTNEIAMTPREGQNKLREEIQKLQQTKEKLRKQRVVLDGKLHEGALLSPQEERRLIELEEAVEALDAAIDYKNESIITKQQEIRRSVATSQNEDSVVDKLRSLTATESRTLLTKYFERVIDMKEIERQKDHVCSELEMKVDEQERVIRELDASLQRAAMDADRKVTMQQQEYERKLQLLVRQLAESESTPTTTDQEKENKIQQLEKDLYYYKKTSRDLKRKLREFVVSASQTSSIGNPDGDKENDVNVYIPTPREAAVTPTSHREADSKSTTPRPPRQGTHSTGTYVIPNSSHEKGEPNSLTPRLPGSGQNSHSSQAEWDRLSQVRDAVPSIRISRKDLRRMSKEEVSLRKSEAEQNDFLSTADSLEVQRNPWK